MLGFLSLTILTALLSLTTLHSFNFSFTLLLIIFVSLIILLIYIDKYYIFYNEILRGTGLVNRGFTIGTSY